MGVIYYESKINSQLALYDMLAALRRTGKVKSTKGKLWTLSDEFG